MRSEELYLRDIVEAASHIESFLVGVAGDAFEKSELLRSAVVQKLSVMGEAATHISNSMRIRYPQIPWGKLSGFRNILVHAYFGTDWKIAEVLRLEFQSNPPSAT
jgi:uncharacterized protein with HEPN domain